MAVELLQKATKHTFVRYVVVGGTSYVVELSSLLALYHFDHMSRGMATAVAYWIGLIIAFILQKLIAFQDYRKEVKTLTRQGVIYSILTLWNWIFTITVVSLFSSKYIILSRTLAQAMLTIWNYAIYKRIIFKKDVDIAV